MLSVVTAENALEILEAAFSRYDDIEKTDIMNASSRVLMRDILSDEYIPAFDRSMVDGFAVKARDTFGAGENMPAMLSIKGEILMGEEISEGISTGECMKISTGGMLPPGADSVIMCEYTDEGFDGMCLCYRSVAVGENVSRKGDDVKKGDTVLKKGSVINSKSTGVLAALGITEIECVKMPVAGIISTGDEIVDCSEKPGAGQIRDVNSVLISSVLRENGVKTVNYGIVKDVREEIENTFHRALSECDMVFLSGGSSKGERDMTAEIISENGELLFHGLAMKPGKPTIAGSCSGKPVFGLPGHPAAAFYVTKRLVIPFIKYLTGNNSPENKGVYILGSDIPSNHGREEIVPVRTEDSKAFPLFGKSGLVSLLSMSDGYIVIDRNREGAFAGEESEVFFTR